MNTSDALTNFVDQFNAPASTFRSIAPASAFPTLVPTPAFPTLEDFNVSSTRETLKWTDLVQDTVYQIMSIRTVNTQHGQSIILSLQEADGCCCSAWACGMLTKEVQQTLGELTVMCMTNRVENEQDWKGIQFLSTDAVLTICKLFYTNI